MDFLRASRIFHSFALWLQNRYPALAWEYPLVRYAERKCPADVEDAAADELV